MDGMSEEKEPISPRNRKNHYQPDLSANNKVKEEVLEKLNSYIEKNKTGCYCRLFQSSEKKKRLRFAQDFQRKVSSEKSKTLVDYYYDYVDLIQQAKQSQEKSVQSDPTFCMDKEFSGIFPSPFGINPHQAKDLASTQQAVIIKDFVEEIPLVVHST